MADFTQAEWTKIKTLFDQRADDFDLPKRRNKSVLIGTFNIRKLGGIDKRPAECWHILAKTIARFDLIAIQEVMDDLSGLEHLANLLGDDYGMVVSDVTGQTPGSDGNAERLAYLFNWKRVQRTALASDITYDRSDVAKNLFENRLIFTDAWGAHKAKLDDYDSKKRRGRKPKRPALELPAFLTFIRQPHCVSFRIKGANDADPYEFIIVNAHLLYGSNKQERRWEFDALLNWLTYRAQNVGALYHKNLLLLGDCNLDFSSRIGTMRAEIDTLIKGLNTDALEDDSAATANFPMLTEHPAKGVLRTALRQKQTYDQIGFFNHDPRLPVPEDNLSAGQNGVNGYDYGVFNLGELVSEAIHGKPLNDLTKDQKKALYARTEHDLSDHMPAWVRLPLPA